MKFKIVTIFFLIAAIVASVFFLNDLIGSAPSESLVKKEKDFSLFPELKPYQAEIKTLTGTKRIEKLKEYAEILKAKVQATKHQELTYEYISALTEILKAEPKEAGALIELANISFESQVFSKAAKYYQEYLLEEPTDLVARTRYASALIFLEQFDLGLHELNQVLSVRPDNFSALAYKAIVQAQLGQTEEAKITGSLAIDNAPDAAGKERLTRFLASLDRESLPAYEQYLRTNEITKDKFVESMVEDAVLKLFFRDFPVDQMPAVARSKFEAKLLEDLDSEIASIQIVDIESQKVLLSIGGE